MNYVCVKKNNKLKCYIKIPFNRICFGHKLIFNGALLTSNRKFSIISLLFVIMVIFFFFFTNFCVQNYNYITFNMFQ